ncbi:uridine phosphorylase [Thermoflavifilum aggregans]|uniref:Uridine phosphorylase n=1 Tax=Thermoflavifilum aggregans TaxID=454188 RepID=A0A2M9CU96_9BACT|nr:nucleoside phosphorylase [Thermoflavifilum aggregans]MBX6381252.1 nucleoside phosphorylase [Thermoflavifilum aggregans]PJJ75459.1 uridine phosphorylase [Thermoflavifilum aggregans]
MIASSELILNERGAVYHLDLRPEEIAHTIITVGDPGRVPVVSRHFDRIEVQRSHREFVTHTGTIGNRRLTVISSGIGTDNIDIVLNELDALVNIDLQQRTRKPDHTSLQLFRLGTCGGLQADVPTDALVISTHGLGLDNLMHYYALAYSDEEQELIRAFISHAGWDHAPLKPYLVAADPDLLKSFTSEPHQLSPYHGITASCPGFYGPQGRQVRAPLAYPQLVDQLSSFRFQHHRITNFEMETSALYGLGRLLGHRCLSISTIVANRAAGTFSSDSQKAIERMITRFLECWLSRES